MPSTGSHPRRDLLRRRLFKPLGLSILAIVSLMAMGAPAQAQTLLVQSNGVEVNPATITGVVKPGMLLLDLFNILCSTGTAIATITRVGTDLEGQGGATFKECTVPGFPKCFTRSPDQEEGSGTITAEGEGLVTMKEGLTLALLESTRFTTVIVEGVFCPLGELEEVVAGSVILDLDNPEKEEKTKLALLDEELLSYANAKAFLEGDVNGVGSGPIDVLAKLSNGEPWAIVLHK